VRDAWASSSLRSLSPRLRNISKLVRASSAAADLLEERSFLRVQARGYEMMQPQHIR